VSDKETGLAGGSLQARSDDQLSGSISSEITASAATTQAENANQVLKFHPLADIFPLMEGAEFDALVADIKKNGHHARIVLKDGMILDGRNRYRACRKLGIEPSFACEAYSDQIRDPAAYVISANIHRRHLTAEQKRDLIAKLIKAQPEKSDRAIGKMAKADGKTVAAIRAKQEGRAEIPHIEKRTDTKGRKQPAQKKTNTKGRKRPTQTAKPKRSTSQDQRELEAKQAHINELEAAREHDRDSAEQLRLAEIKTVGLEGEIADLKDENVALKTENAALKTENADLRKKLEAAQVAS
jgi:hypothetical protein